jgi:hypothetical protein
LTRLIPVALLVLAIGCAKPKPVSPPPPPPPKPVLKKGGWVIRHCKEATPAECYCNYPIEHIYVPKGSTDQYSIIECREHPSKGQ